MGWFSVAVMALGWCAWAAFGQSGPTTYGDLLPPEVLAQIQATQIASPPTPPPGAVRPLASPGKSATSKTLAVPTSTWTYGCTATSAGMIFAYYDRNGYPDLYTGPANGGVCPMTDLGQGINAPIAGACSIIATQNGFDGRTVPGHADDYWIGYDEAGPDPWEGVRAEHAWGGCTADYMGTNQWKWDYDVNGSKDTSTDGATTYFSYDSAGKLYDYVPPSFYGTPQTEACHGLRLFAESRGCTVQENYTQKIDTLYAGGFSFANYVAEIDSGRPVMIHVTGHTMVGVGYDTAGSIVYLNDTWDNAVHSMTWGGSYSGMTMECVTIIHLAPAGTDPGSVTVTLEPAEAVAAGAQWRLDGGAWNDSAAVLTGVTAGVHTLSFKEVADWDTPPSQEISVSSNQLNSASTVYRRLCQGPDACNRAWTTTGHAVWFAEGTVTHDASDAAQAGDVDNNGFSSLSTEVIGPATFTFWWRVDSEENYDYLTFSIDGDETAQISGAVDWAQQSHTLGAGTHTLSWVYAKDSSVSEGADTGWLDQFVVLDTTPPTGTVTVNNNRSATNNVNVTLTLAWDDGADGSGVTRMRFSDNGATWTEWEPVAATRAYTLPAGADGHRTVRVQYLDRAGNRSAVVADYIRLDTSPPTGAILINSGAAATSSPSVTLGLTWSDGTGAGVSRMRFSDDGAHWTVWMPVEAVRAHVLPGPAGYNTVRVQFLDGAGNYSGVYNDYIRLLAP